MQKYLYHMVPPQMFGTKLYPLNQLKEINPELYTKCSAKYQGRESLMEFVIPKLNCLWNDVLHLSPIDPRIIAQSIEQISGQKPRDMHCYKIPLESLNLNKTIIYHYSSETLNKPDSDFEMLSLSNCPELKSLPDDTLNYYKRSYEAKKRPLLFHRIPHVLTMEPVDTTGLEVISWLEY